MSEEAVRESQGKLDFEKVWAMFQESVREQDRRSQELDRRFQETDRQFQETRQMMRETDRKISRLGSRIGDLIEELILPNLTDKFNKLGYTFGKAAAGVKYSDAQGRFIAEVDLLLENGGTVLVVEVKTNLTTLDVKDHVKRMEKLRVYADEHQDGRKLLGAVAGAITSGGVKDYAVKQGFFVLEQSGDTVRISVPNDFKPREW